MAEIDFFISYNSIDVEWAKWVDGQLRAEGYSTLVQVYDFRPGENFVLKMQEAAREADRTLVLLSPEYLDAVFTQPEWAAAFFQDPAGKARTLLPVKIRPCTLSGFLSQIIYIDLVDKEEKAATQELLAGLEGTGRPPQPTAFPGRPTSDESETPPFPGALPPVWNVPFLRNPHFTGRQRLLEQLRDILQPDQPAALIQTLQGLGGVGKTQTAVEFAYRHAADYQVVWWVASEETTTLSRDFAALAARLELISPDPQDQSTIVDIVRRWLESHQGWLVIFDNVDEPAMIEALLPRGGSGHVLITSRRTDWDAKINSVDIPAFSRPESLAFLRQRGLQSNSVAGRLAEDVGDLPLALEQAAAYMAQTGLTPQAYLDLFAQRKRDLLLRGIPKDHPDAAATTWDISFQALMDQDPAAGALLHLCAFLAPDDIPLSLLSGSSEHCPSPLREAGSDPIRLNDAIVAAQRYSLLTRAGDALSVHRLVQASIRHRLSPEARMEWSSAAAALVNSAFNYEKHQLETWPLSARLLSHCQACLGHLNQEQITASSARLLNQTGLYLMHCGFLDAARAHLQRALEMDKALYGEWHPNIAIRANNLGQVLRAQGHLKEALQWAQRALIIDQEALGEHHANIAIRANNIGQILKDEGDLEGALQWTQRALEIGQNIFGEDHPKIATYTNNLATILKGQDRLEEATRLTQRALAIFKKAFGDMHPNVATLARNLGQILSDQGDLEGALTWTQQALDIDQEIFGLDHPSVAISASCLGSIWIAKGDLEKALQWVRRALDINRKIYGDDHPRVAFDANNFGQILKKQGDFKNARRHLERALAIFEEVLGPDNPSTIKVRNNLAEL